MRNHRTRHDAYREQVRTKLYQEYERKLAEAMRAVDLLESLGLDPPTDNPEVGDSDADGREAGGARRVPMNEGPSWAQAIDEVLTDAQEPMTVKEITEELILRGRKFPGARPTVTVAPVVQRRKDGMGWEKVRGSKPARWRKRKEAASS